MKNLFEPTTANEVKERIGRLGPNSERQWGKMTAPQMMAWVADWVRRGGPTLDKPTHFESRDGQF